jgi:U4/U6.U5 tri-snRNP component SNU23
LGLPALKQKRIEEDDSEPKELMKIREKKIDLDGNIGKIQVVQDSKQPGYYCKHCDITVKDSINYLDHINGRKRT